MHVEISIQLNMPLDVVYRQWTQFEAYPYFMAGVKSVQRLSDIRQLWLGDIGGVECEWYAEVLDMVPNQLITYQAVSGAAYIAVIRFTFIDQDHCQVQYSMVWEDDAVVDKAQEFQDITTTLTRFKSLIEDPNYDETRWRSAVERAVNVLWEHNTAEVPIRSRAAK